MQKKKQAYSHILTGSREEITTVNKRQQAEEGASIFSPADKIQGRKSHCEQETTSGGRSKQILTG
jgi:hypothetical protein